MTTELEKLLAAARARWDALTPEQRREADRRQRRGYIMAEAAMGSDADEAAYRIAYNKQDVDTLEKLDAEAKLRELRAAKWLDENGY